VLWCPLRFPRKTMFDSSWLPYVFCRGFMFYLCYVYLFTYTGVQHDFHIRLCSCRSGAHDLWFSEWSFVGRCLSFCPLSFGHCSVCHLVCGFILFLVHTIIVTIITFSKYAHGVMVCVLARPCIRVPVRSKQTDYEIDICCFSVQDEAQW
jgi:hypothetical protein